MARDRADRGASSPPDQGPRGPRTESDSRRFGRNFASTALAQLVAQVLALLVSIVLARKLGVAAYGIFVFGFAFPSWFLLLISLGMDDIMVIRIAADRSRASRYLTLVSLLRLLLAGIAFAVLWVGTEIVLSDPAARTVTLVLGLSSIVTTYTATFSSVFRGFERFEYPAGITIAQQAFTVSATLVLLFLGFGLLEVSLVYLVGAFLNLFLSIVFTRRRFVWFTRRVALNETRRIVRDAVPFGLNGVVATFTLTAGPVLLTILQDPESTGIFNAAFTIILGLFSFLNIVSLAALPMMSRIHHESVERLSSVLNQIQRLCFIVGVPLAFGGWLYAGPIMTTFYGDAFLASSESFRLLILSFAVETAVMGIGPALAATDHMMVRVWIGALGAAMTIVLSVLLIPAYGPAGVAYAFLAASVVSAILSVIAVQKYVAPLRGAPTLARSVFAGALMTLVLLVVPGLSLWTGIGFGALVYFAALLAVGGLPMEDRVALWSALRGALFG